MFHRRQVVDDSVEPSNRQQLVDDLGQEIIFYIPWGHKNTILRKCKGDKDKALFYVKKNLENNWSRDVLLNFLDTDLYERAGKAVTNFDLTLPEEYKGSLPTIEEIEEEFSGEDALF